VVRHQVRVALPQAGRAAPREEMVSTQYIEGGSLVDAFASEPDMEAVFLRSRHGPQHYEYYYSEEERPVGAWDWEGPAQDW
jgi:hypothetical protein